MNSSASPKTTSRKVGTPGRALWNISGYVVYFLAAVFIAFPVLWMFLGSIIPEDSLLLLGLGRGLPSTITLKNYYRALFVDTYVVRSIADTLFYSMGSTVIAVVCGSIGGYSFARFRFPGRRTLLLAAIALQTSPGLSLALPLYLLMRQIGWYDTFHGLIYIYSGWYTPFVAWLMIGFFEGIPQDLIDSAQVDGCSRWGTIPRIVLPLAAAGVFASAVWVFLSVWGDFIFGIIFTGGRINPITVTVARLVTRAKVEYSYMAAQSVLAMLLPLIIVGLFQKRLVKGLVAGAVKG